MEHMLSLLIFIFKKKSLSLYDENLKRNISIKLFLSWILIYFFNQKKKKEIQIYSSQSISHININIDSHGY